MTNTPEKCYKQGETWFCFCGNCPKPRALYEGPVSAPERSWEELEAGIRAALHWPKELDALSPDMDSRSSIERVVDLFKETLASERAALIGKVGGMKCTGTMKDLPEMREFNHALDKVLALLKETNEETNYGR